MLHPLRFWYSPPTLLNSLNYFIAGSNPFIYHLTNILLHSLNTLLVLLLLGVFFTEEASFLGALLFALHPIHTEAVSWITGGSYLLIAFFTLVILLLYNNSTNPERGFRPLRYFLCFLIFGYTLAPYIEFRYCLIPFLLVLFDLSLGRAKKNWKFWVPFFLAAGLKVMLSAAALIQRTYAVAAKSGAAQPVWNNPLLTAAHSLFSNFALLLWPLRLTLYHEPVVAPPLLLSVEAAFTLLLLISLPFIFKREKAVFFGIGFFILFISPTFSPFAVGWLIAERYLYLPSLALSIFIAFGYDRYSVKSPRLKSAFLSVIVLIASLFILRTVIRNEDWANPGRFWRQTLKASPGSANVHIKVADVYRSEGNFKQALAELEKAIAMNPENPVAYHNLGNTYATLNEKTKASSAYLKAVELNPGFAEAYFNLGNLASSSGDKERAVYYYRKAIEANPGTLEAYINLGVAYESLGKMQEAVAAYGEALAVYPRFGLAHNNLAAAYYRSKEYALAVKHCDLAVKYGYKVKPGLLRSLEQYRKR